MKPEEHLNRQYNQREKEYEKRDKLINGLRQKRVVETDTKEKFKIDDDIKEAEKEQKKLYDEMSILEKKIKSEEKSNQATLDDEFTDENQEKFKIWASIDGFSHKLEAEGFEQENTRSKAYATLNQLKNVHKKDTRVSDGLKDENRKIYKKSQDGQQMLLKDDDPIFSDDILESRPDAVKG